LAYRDSASRSIRGVAQELGKSATLVARWSSEDSWPDRVAAWQAECDRRRREAFHDAGAEVAWAQAEDAALLREALMGPARSLRTRIERVRAEGGEDLFQELSAAELLRLTATASRALAQVAQVERLAHGLSTENSAGHDGGALSREAQSKSIEELKAYLAGPRQPEFEQR
jgi:hypothetical protein